MEGQKLKYWSIRYGGRRYIFAGKKPVIEEMENFDVMGSDANYIVHDEEGDMTDLLASKIN